MNSVFQRLPLGTLILVVSVGCSSTNSWTPSEEGLNIMSPVPETFSAAATEILKQDSIDRPSAFSAIVGQPIALDDAWMDRGGRRFHRYALTQPTVELAAADVFIRLLTNPARGENLAEIRIRDYRALGCLDFNRVIATGRPSWTKSVGLGIDSQRPGYEATSKNGEHIIRIAIGLRSDSNCVVSVSVMQVS